MRLMNKKMIKTLIMIMILTMFSVSSVYATVTGILGGNPTPNGGELETIGGNILGYVVWFGWAIAVGTILVLGIRYMMSSANERADLKNGSIRYVIGVLVFALSATLCNIIMGIFAG